MNFTQSINMIAGGFRSAWGDPHAWEASIRYFEENDRLRPPAPGGIVFTGSSSFTLWETLEADMAPLPAINRGFGGAKMADVVRYAERVVLAYRPRTVVLFAGTNDIAHPRPATAGQVYEGYKAFVACVQAALPETVIYYLAITPTPLRWEFWPAICEANRLIREHARSDARLRFIDLSAHLLGPDGKPIRSLYRMDRLHPNAAGYAVWKAVIKPILEADFRQ
jgi:lysophospholipase L1-like esterase